MDIECFQICNSVSRGVNCDGAQSRDKHFIILERKILLPALREKTRYMFSANLDAERYLSGNLVSS